MTNIIQGNFPQRQQAKAVRYSLKNDWNDRLQSRQRSYKEAILLIDGMFDTALYFASDEELKGIQAVQKYYIEQIRTEMERRT